jgi:biotin carboxyl carrier protein
VIFDASVDGRELRVEVKRANGRFAVTLGDQRLEVDFVPADEHFASLLVAGKSYEVAFEPRAGGYAVFLPGDVLEVQLQDASRAVRAPARKASHGPARVHAPMPGKIVRVLVAVGDTVASGQGLLVMEAMKMENELRAARAGRVRELKVAEGQAVDTGALLVVLE